MLCPTYENYEDYENHEDYEGQFIDLHGAQVPMAGWISELAMRVCQTRREAKCFVASSYGKAFANEVGKRMEAGEDMGKAIFHTMVEWQGKPADRRMRQLGLSDFMGGAIWLASAGQC